MRRIMKSVKSVFVAVVVMGLISAPAWGAPVKDKESPAKEGAETAGKMMKKGAEDTVEKTRQGAELVAGKTRKTTEKMTEGARKVSEKTVEAGRRTIEAVTQDKVQAGLSGGAMVGVPAGGAGYLIAAATGMSNPVTAGIITGAVITGTVGYKTAEQYEQTHQPG